MGGVTRAPVWLIRPWLPLWYQFNPDFGFHRPSRMGRRQQIACCCSIEHFLRLIVWVTSSFLPRQIILRSPCFARRLVQTHQLTSMNSLMKIYRAVCLWWLNENRIRKRWLGGQGDAVLDQLIIPIIPPTLGLSVMLWLCHFKGHFETTFSFKTKLGWNNVAINIIN